ncbi:MAG: hypothetical protein JWM95_486 [Gemmatimonadetes bacterium]|nr:hypothetical protein [Gemmatimonadota bacterium]
MTVFPMSQSQEVAQGSVNGEQLKQEIKQTIRDATSAAREAAQEAGGAGRIVILAPDAPMPPGSTLMPPGFLDPGNANNNDIPPQAAEIALMFLVFLGVIIIGWPLARAFGRRLERRPEVPALSPGMADQLQRIEQAVDAMAIEVERISESQRFMARLQSSQTPERAS